MPRAIGLLAFSLAVAACGGEDIRRAGGGGGGLPEPGPFVAQEIWLSYHSPEHADIGKRSTRTRDEARALAESLRARVAKGEDIGALAREHSNAPGAAAFGFSYWLGGRAESRDLEVRRTRVGQLTDIVEWNGGMWFGRRVSEERGRELQALFEKEMRRRAKVEAIAVVWKGAWGLTEDDRVERTKEQAITRADEALRRALAGEPFPRLVREYSEDRYSRERGGAIWVAGPDGRGTDWIRPQEPWLPVPLLDAVFAAEVGKVHPRVIVTSRGVFVIRVTAREGDS